MIPGDRLVCIFIQPSNVVTEFKQRPLHVTLIPWFRLEKSTNQLAADLKQLLADVRPFTVHMAKEKVKFGFWQDKFVTLVQYPTPLQTLEHQLRNYMHANNAWLVDETTTHPHIFMPHVTEQGANRLARGDSFVCEGVSIVEQRGSFKRSQGFTF